MRPVGVGFVLLSDSHRPLPSTRIAALNMFPFLRAAGFAPQIVFEPAGADENPDLTGLAPSLLERGLSIVVFQKVHGPSAEALAQRLAAAGVKTVYCVCDLVDLPMARACDATVVVTDFLKSLYPATLQARIHVVHDGIEHPELCKRDWGGGHGTRARPLRAVLVTSAALDRLPMIGAPPAWLEVHIVGAYPPAPALWQRLRHARWTLAGRAGLRARAACLRFLANRRIRRVAWHPFEMYQHMTQADIGIIPIDTWPEAAAGQTPPAWQLKSENRLSMKMCAGLPVIATPIPAYLPLIEQGKNGLLASWRDDWMAGLDALRDPALRASIGRRARATVLERYSMREQARLLIALLSSLAPPDLAPTQFSPARDSV
jgi:glycosyltransferase involved in cell wall biosynthesis